MGKTRRRIRRSEIASRVRRSRREIIKEMHKEHTSPKEHPPSHIWVIEKRRGYDDKLLHTYMYPTKDEAVKAHAEFRNALKYSGMGGRWTEYYTYPVRIERPTGMQIVKKLRDARKHDMLMGKIKEE